MLETNICPITVDFHRFSGADVVKVDGRPLVFSKRHFGLVNINKKKLAQGIKVSMTSPAIYVDLGVNWANTLFLFEPLRSPQRPYWTVVGFEASPLVQSFAEDYFSYTSKESG